MIETNDTLSTNFWGRIELPEEKSTYSDHYLVPSGNLIQKFVHVQTPGEKLFTGAALTVLTGGAVLLGMHFGLSPYLIAALGAAPVGAYGLLTLTVPNRQWVKDSVFANQD